MQNARYAFSALAVFLIAERFGESSVSKIWKRVGRVPLEETDMSSLEKAYRRVTGSELANLVAEVQTRPVGELLSELEAMLTE